MRKLLFSAGVEATSFSISFNTSVLLYPITISSGKVWFECAVVVHSFFTRNFFPFTSLATNGVYAFTMSLTFTVSVGCRLFNGCLVTRRSNARKICISVYFRTRS